MTLNKIKKTYREYLEFLSITYNLHNKLAASIDFFLKNYCKSERYDKNFAYELDVNLIILERIQQNIEDIFEKIENVSIDKIKTPTKEIERNLHIVLSKDEDIHVDSRNSIRYD